MVSYLVARWDLLREGRGEHWQAFGAHRGPVFLGRTAAGQSLFQRSLSFQASTQTGARQSPPRRPAATDISWSHPLRAQVAVMQGLYLRRGLIVARYARALLDRRRHRTAN